MDSRIHFMSSHSEPSGTTPPTNVREMSSVAEMEVEAAAEPGARSEEFVFETARWQLPEGPNRHESDAEHPAHIRPKGVHVTGKALRKVTRG